MKLSTLPMFAKIGGVVILALVLALGAQTLRLAWRSADLAECREDKAELAAAIRRQNEAIERMQQEGEAMATEQQQRLEEARAENSAQDASRLALRQGAVTPRGDGPCVISPALRSAEGL